MEYQYGQNNETGNYQGTNDYIYYHNQTGGNGPAPEPDWKKKKKSGKGIVPLCVALSLVMGTAGGALGSGLVMQQYNKEAAAQQAAEQQIQESFPQTTEPAAGTPTSSTAESGLSIKQISEMCLPSVVAITNKGEAEIRSLWGTFTQETEGSGSGVIIGKTDQELMIVTNYHVVSGSRELSVMFSYQEGGRDISDAQIADAEIKDYDSSKDLAVIAVDLSSLSQETMDNIKVATLGDSEELVLGEQVVAIGNALGYGQSITTGIVSALGRTVSAEASGETIGSANQYIQTDAAINPGNSGGALLNMKGEVVGINAAKYSSTDVEGIGYAIPVSQVQDIIDSLMTKRTRNHAVEEGQEGYLGIQALTVDESMVKQLDMPAGVFVYAIIDGGAASKSDLREKDVITKFDDQSIRSMAALEDLLQYYRAGETVNLTVQSLENGKYVERTVEITLGERTEMGQETQRNSPR